MKLKEISYIHAEGFAAGEMKHGPINCSYRGRYTSNNVLISDGNEDKAISNLQEAYSKRAKIILIADKNCVIYICYSFKDVLNHYYHHFLWLFLVKPLKIKFFDFNQGIKLTCFNLSKSHYLQTSIKILFNWILIVSQKDFLIICNI